MLQEVLQDTHMVQLFTKPIASSAPPYPQFDHSQPPVGCAVSGPKQTNNTFNNLLLDNQTFPTWPLPYSLWVTRDGNDHGMALNHTDSNQLVYGPDPAQNPSQFYFNPPKIVLWVFGATGWDSVDVLTVESRKLSAVVELSHGGGKINMPIAYGMGFVTGVYQNATPLLSSMVGVQHFEPVGVVNKNRTAKYVATLFNGVQWSIYVSNDPAMQLLLRDPNHIQGNKPGNNCTIQVCKGVSRPYDDTCGQFVTSATYVGSVEGNKGYYGFKYSTMGESFSGSPLVWCLPHHEATLSAATRQREAGMSLFSPTKGFMKAYVTDTLLMEVPDLPIDIGFDPWTSVQGFSFKREHFDESAKKLIKEAAENEVKQDVLSQCDLDSMYFGGKQLDKYAQIAYCTHFVLRDATLTQQVLPRIKEAIEKYAKNQQKNPLQYDRQWKGLVSCAPPDQDFGNANYNDHHFHYGYHVHAISLVAKIDPGWLSQNDNLIANYAQTLIRDYANPSDSDPFFPQSRNFDWFHGHSFAHGIFPSGDGKNEESSSEDYHSIYALKLYGQVIGDLEMEMGANLMLGIMRTSLNMYMLYSNDNTIEPPQFIGNKVSGILFENKIDFATFFGRGTVGDEFIHGIHMIPITPISLYIRNQGYVKEEWDSKLAGIVDRIPDGWRGILMLNAGLFDPKYLWRFFTDTNWTESMIDPGMSKTWSLTYLAGIGGSK